MTDETLLIERIRNGDHDAFRALYENHVDALYRFLHQFSRDSNLVEEWVQRTFVKIYRSIDRFAGRSSFATWLFAVGLNEMKSDRRKPLKIFVEEIPASASIPDNPHDRFEWDDMMKDWLRELDDVRRSVFVLHEIEGFSHAEIGEMLEIGESTSRTILSRTRQWLRERWTKERGPVQ